MELEAEAGAGRRRWLALAGVLVLAASSADADELIRYRRGDGSVGFAGSESGVPAGSEILERTLATEPTEPARPAAIPTVDELLAGVRRHCESRRPHRGADFDFCIADQTREAFHFRDLLLEQAADGSGTERVEGCRRRLGRGAAPNYRKLMRCARTTAEEPAPETGAELPPAARTGDQRLRDLRDEQRRGALENEIGRNLWRPRYREAENALREAERQRRAIEDAMERRGCRTDSLACGGLGPRLDDALREEAAKRDHLEHGLPEECRLAGCQPGWLR